MNCALDALSALSQETRLNAFRLLVRHEPVGLPAGDIAGQLGVPHNTLSTHLALLVQAGMATRERTGRTIVYRADLERFRALTLFLLKDCCGGRAEICAPLIAEMTSCCVKEKRRA